MNNKKQTLTSLLVFLVCVVVTLVLVLNKINNYLIIAVPVTLIAGFYFISELKDGMASDKEKYENEVNRIIKTYDGILVNTNKFPKLKNKSLLYVNKIEDLVDAQAEMRKPIYYVKRESATAFYLLNDDIFLIYFIKLDKNELSGLEAEIKRLEIESTIKLENFQDVDKTFILQTDEKSFKVSPIRDNQEEQKETPKEENKPEEKKENEVKKEEPKQNVQPNQKQQEVKPVQQNSNQNNNNNPQEGQKKKKKKKKKKNKNNNNQNNNVGGNNNG